MLRALTKPKGIDIVINCATSPKGKTLGKRRATVSTAELAGTYIVTGTKKI
jgi:hypothetical protein